MSEPIIFEKKPTVMELEPGTYYWCSCGHSAKQPFCDGSHKGTELTPVAFDITEKKSVALCLCKHTNNLPFCDGSHSRL
ncbi:MAG: CDGSH iron-sulfur domain-containing protein [Limnoraphis sp. WC205]|jgi:CDGSH-type Zn-finger protein|nr:CDGSH iron-sulfur domain-containing protein [Limnoraphis sp. WC205]